MTRELEQPWIRSVAGIACAGVLSYGLFLLLSPFVVPVITGGILSSLARPFYERLASLIHSKTLAAFITVLLMVALLLLPFWLLTGIVVGEIGQLGNILASPQGNIDALNHFFGSLTTQLGYTKIVDIREYGIRLLQSISENPSLLIGSVVSFLGTVFFSLITMFYLLQSHDQFRRAFLAYSPLSPEDSGHILKRTREVLRATVRGNLVLLALQTFASTVGFFLFGIPTPVLLGILYGISSLIPAIGSSLVWVPIAVYQFVQGNTLVGIGVTCWSIAQVILFDNYLGPRLIQRKAHLHPFLILLGILGGVAKFGALGVLVGPTMVALGLVGLEILHRAWTAPRQ